MVELTPGRGRPDNENTMLRVLLVLEDYGELMFLQTILKKIGFDVDSTQNPRKFADSLLGLNPDVVVMTGQGKRIKGVELATQIKKNRGLPHLILIRSGNLSQDLYKEIEVSAWLESPVSAPDLLDRIAELGGLNKQSLQEKLLKLRMQEETADTSRILKVKDNDTNAGMTLEKSASPESHFGVLKGSSMTKEDRRARFKKFLDEPAPSEHGFQVKSVQEQVKALRKEESEADLESLEKERRAFVEHLFKKKVS